MGPLSFSLYRWKYLCQQPGQGRLGIEISYFRTFFVLPPRAGSTPVSRTGIEHIYGKKHQAEKTTQHSCRMFKKLQWRTVQKLPIQASTLTRSCQRPGQDIQATIVWKFECLEEKKNNIFSHRKVRHNSKVLHVKQQELRLWELSCKDTCWDLTHNQYSQEWGDGVNLLWLLTKISGPRGWWRKGDQIILAKVWLTNKKSVQETDAPNVYTLNRKLLPAVC